MFEEVNRDVFTHGELTTVKDVNTFLERTAFVGVEQCDGVGVVVPTQARNVHAQYVPRVDSA